jgi:hypothetical protein
MRYGSVQNQEMQRSNQEILVRFTDVGAFDPEFLLDLYRLARVHVYGAGVKVLSGGFA